LLLRTPRRFLAANVTSYYMKKLLTILFFAFSITIVDAQKLYLMQYSSFCENDTDDGFRTIKERINRIYKFDNLWRVEITVNKGCGVKLYPKLKILNDTLYINTIPISKQEIFLENSESFIEIPEELDCFCAHIVKMDISIDTIKNLKINGKKLPITNEIYETYPILYYTYKTDTTGYEDKYGLRQGYIVLEKKGFIMKQYFKDNKLIKCEIFTSDGKLLEKGVDCFDTWKKIEKK